MKTPLAARGSGVFFGRTDSSLANRSSEKDSRPLPFAPFPLHDHFSLPQAQPVLREDFMTAIVPYPFLFRYAIPVERIDKLPKRGKRLLNLPESCRLPNLRAIEEAQPFADVRAAWNAKGLAFQLNVTGKKHPLDINRTEPAESDGLQLWIDTRDTQNIHRASRFCHHLCLLPTGTGRSRRKPLAVHEPIARAREEQKRRDSGDIQIVSDIRKSGYTMEVWIPGKELTGFDPEQQRRVGFYYYIRDSELGDQFLTVGHEFPFASDPSIWSTLNLGEATRGH